MYKEKLREFLKEVPEVKEQMEKLEFGTSVKYIGKFPQYYEGEHKILYVLGDGETIETMGGKDQSMSHTLCKEDYEIIGLPLQERFIRMYCDNKGLEFFFTNQFLLIGKDKINGIHLKIDNTKDLENQSETFYKELYESLLELNKLG